MASPVSPACVISAFRADCFVDPGADAAAGLFEGGAELTYHQGIRHEIESEHQNPAEDYLYSVEVNEAIQHVSESPNRGECHEGQGVPVDFLGVFHKRPSFDIKLYLSV